MNEYKKIIYLSKMAVKLPIFDFDIDFGENSKTLFPTEFFNEIYAYKYRILWLHYWNKNWKDLSRGILGAKQVFVDPMLIYAN